MGAVTLVRIAETEEQLALRELARDLFTAYCPPEVTRGLKAGVPGPADGTAPDAALWSALAKAGLLGLAIPEDLGGEGAGLYELGVLFHEGGRALAPTRFYTTQFFALAIERLAEKDTAQNLLRPVCSGDVTATLACWNPADASDLRPPLRAQQVDGRWVLDGTIENVSNADRATRLLVTAAAPISGHPDRVLGFVLNPRVPAVARQALRTIAGDSSSRLVVDGYRVDIDAGDAGDAVLSGLDGSGLSERGLRWVAQVAVALQSMEMAGGAQAVLDRTVAYVSEREQFGRPIGSFQAVQHQIADCRIAVEGARLAAGRAVFQLGLGEIATRGVAIAKMHASRAYVDTTLTAHQLHGGMGYVRDTDLHLWSERAKVTEVAGGNADVAAGWLTEGGADT